MCCEAKCQSSSDDLLSSSNQELPSSCSSFALNFILTSGILVGESWTCERRELTQSERHSPNEDR